MGRLFGLHRVRATFYHMVAIVFLISTALWLMGIVDDKMSYYITAVLFVVDYLAEMYDPHPENPGPWFKAHFHRAIDGEPEMDEYDTQAKELQTLRAKLKVCKLT